MTLARTILRPAARLAGMHASMHLRRFLRALNNPRQVQEQLLAQLLAHHADTGFGRAHNLAAVRNYDDFRRAVPVSTYDSLLPWLSRVYQGDERAMFPAGVDVLMFALTSGTTGQPKRIPVTQASLAHYRRGWNVFGIRMLNDHPRAWLRKILQVSSPPVEAYSPAGKPCGAISGMLAATQKKIVRRMYPVPSDVMTLADPATKYYTIMRLAMPEDVAFVSTANPSTIIQLMATARTHLPQLLRDLHDGTLTGPGEIPGHFRSSLRLRKHPKLTRRIEACLARDGELLFTHFWDLTHLAHWTGGTLGLYLPEVRRLTGNVPIRDIGLLASEGRFSLPLTDNTSEGPAEIVGSLLEFIPAGEIDSDQPTVLRVHELDVGQEYFLIFSNFSGLWRYNINDRVRVTGRVGQTPVLAFLSKGSHTANLTGEKLTEHQVVHAFKQACRSLDLSIPRFVAQAHFASPPHYRFTVEWSGGALPITLAELIEQALQKQNIEYQQKRHTGRLGPVSLAMASPDYFAAREADILRRRKKAAEQYKHQYLLTDIVTGATDGARSPADGEATRART